MSDNIRLTRDAKKLALAMVRLYKRRIKQGEDKAKARYFGNPYQVSPLAPGRSLSDVADLVWELKAAGFVSVLPGDDLFSACELTTLCITWSENRILDTIKKVFSALINLFLSAFE